MTTILGINAYHADASASLLVDGQLSGAIEEERLNRVKHCTGFPSLAVAKVMEMGDVSLAELGHVAIGRDPKANFTAKLKHVAMNPRLAKTATSRAKNASLIQDVPQSVRRALGATGPTPFKFHYVEHHRAHIASAFFCSPFEEAACLSIDGFGDFVSTMIAVGRGNKIEVLDQVHFPHSMGIFYQAMTQFLGFTRYGEEWKVMGLAPYGEPKYVEQLRQMVHIKPSGLFRLNLDYFLHDKQNVEMNWLDGSPSVGRLWSPKWEELLGPTRHPEDDFYGKWADIARSAQVVYEEVLFHILNTLHQRTGISNLCMAGGCALNSSANGKIFDQTPFKGLYIQPAAGDDGTAIGAGLYVQHAILNEPRTFVMDHAYTGPDYGPSEVDHAVASTRENNPSLFEGIQVTQLDDEGLVTSVAKHMADGKVVGWFQGRMEYGPRALGNRSIVADPRRGDMKDILNERIKRRETYRPFAPSILSERVGEVFETDEPSPYMLLVYKTREAWRDKIKAVNHINNTGRVQTVEKHVNPRYHALISAFEKETGVPVILNTSFNENEPVVNTPQEALNCFLRTRMDVLAMGNTLLERTS